MADETIRMIIAGYLRSLEHKYLLDVPNVVRYVCLAYYHDDRKNFVTRYTIEPIAGDKDDSHEADKLTIILKNDSMFYPVRVIWNEKKDAKDHVFEAKPGGEVEMKAPAPSDDDNAIVNKLQIILVEVRQETVMANVQFQRDSKLRYLIKIWDQKKWWRI